MRMGFTDTFIHRPILAVVVSLLLLLLGLQSASQLTLREYPYLETSQIEVTTVYPGASASVVLGFVTTPLQRYIAKANGIDYITSTSTPFKTGLSRRATNGAATASAYG